MACLYGLGTTFTKYVSHTGYLERGKSKVHTATTSVHHTNGAGAHTGTAAVHHTKQ